MKPIFFAKMEGTGNDFVLIDNREGLFNELIQGRDLKEMVKKMLDYHFGIGADGLIVLDAIKGYPFSMRYYNPDGSEAALCLNGARCALSFGYRLGLVEDKGKFLTLAGPVGFYYKGENVSIEIPPPTDIKMNFSITIARKKYKCHFLKLGVPHCIVFVDSVEDVDVKKQGEDIRNHKAFKPDGTNVDFVQTDRKGIFVRTYERGLEKETLSCGSGSVSAAYIATKLFIVQSPVLVKTKGGDLIVTLKEKLYIEGPARFVFDGTYYV